MVGARTVVGDSFGRVEKAFMLPQVAYLSRGPGPARHPTLNAVGTPPGSDQHGSRRG